MLIKILSLLLLTLFVCLFGLHAQSRITFCDEVVPIDDPAVYNKLMRTVREWAYVAKLSELRQMTSKYLPWIEKHLVKEGLHPDLKYITIYK